MKKVPENNFHELHVWEFPCPYCDSWEQTTDNPDTSDVIVCFACGEEVEVER